MDMPEPAKVGDLLMVVGKMPQGVWGWPFSTDPDTWLVLVERCEHKKYDGHERGYTGATFWCPNNPMLNMNEWHQCERCWCPGAEIGGDDDAN